MQRLYDNVGEDTVGNGEDMVEVIAKYNGDIKMIAAELGASAEILTENYAIITIARKNIPVLYQYTQIENLELPKNLYIADAYDFISTCVRSVQDKRSYGLTGSGTIVAIIDSGIDYTHPDFRTEDGGTRILYMWDQMCKGTPPAGFSSGAEYNREQINEALRSPDPMAIIPTRDTDGHGTAVAGIAAGNGRESGGVNAGVAPEADLIVVKIGMKGYQSFTKTTELLRALKYVIDKAREAEKPVAINMSFEMNNGSHLGDSLFETYIADMGSRWKNCIVVPTGNEGAAGHHFAGSIGSGETKEIGFFTAAGINNFYISMWKNFADSFSVELVFPGGVSSGMIGIESQVKTVRASNMSLTVIYGQPSRYSISQEIYFEVKAVTDYISSGVWKLVVKATEVVDGKFEMWLPTSGTVTDETYFTNPTSSRTMTIPSTALKVISVAGYNDKIGNIAGFSGVGSENLALPNPDLAAPAVGILTTKAGGGYDSYTGTSMAAPFVTGSAALMMQWGIVQKNSPFVYGERLKGFLRLGASRDTRMRYPNPKFGYGTLCLSATMTYMDRYKWGGDEIWLQT